MTISQEKPEATLQEKWGNGPGFAGIVTFAHFDHHPALLEPEKRFDIGIIGVPFDTATSYRPGARFGPSAIRQGSQRQSEKRGYNLRAGYNPYKEWATMMDCGDIPVTPVSNEVALEQMTAAFEELLLRRQSEADPNHPPRYIALGGDHSIILPHLRALHKVYGRVAVIHFDAHLDTWNSSKRTGYWDSEKTRFTHGSMLWMASHEGLISEDYNVHVGLRARIAGKSEEDYTEDTSQGWQRFSTDDVWFQGTSSMDKIIAQIKKRIPEKYPVYISLDVDCMDPGFAPGTGTIEPGGMTPREVLYLLRGLDFNLVGGDVVEVSPAYDNAEITATAASQVVYELITTMVQKGKPLPTLQQQSLN
ncbi:hypothetical protein OGAPHI_005408 [Ogataea philodendri]|uniref:Agmatinase n=1 Tax=Ogataea philodendri TaxID=1378263 RepID=A0A9P8NYN6_9ASCO|nr:uncharacterized protein OGAPHI_005408 [Ogataea philodendri]KAH3662160.1 hypothetical protein OGAPHI_005408 [Ogataea philodendri]